VVATADASRKNLSCYLTNLLADRRKHLRCQPRRLAAPAVQQ
jgi:hypothetical protein